MKVIGYTRVSTQEQAKDGYGLAAQRAKIAERAAQEGWDVLWCSDEGASGSRINPGLRDALDMLREQEAQALVVAKMDRLARSVLHAADIAATADQQGWNLVVLDLGLDLGTPAGRAMYNMLATFAEFERSMISLRTKEGLKAAKAQGKRLGRRSVIPSALVQRIVAAREAGASFGEIARGLSDEGILSPTGKPVWAEVTVRRTYQSAVA